MERARINGIEISYQLRGRGAPLVMIHGAQGDQTAFDELAAEFSDRYRVLTFDQRGSGLSDKPDMPYSIAMLADDTAALMNHLGLVPAHVFGISMGGTIAQELALRHPAKVRSMVLGCTTPGGPHAVRISGPALTNAYSTQSMTPEERGRALAEAAFTKGYLERHPEVIESMVAARRARPIDSTAFAHRMRAIVDFDAYDRLPQIQCPTLVIAGKDDALINWENSRIIAERIDRAKLVILEPAGHSFWHEQPEKTVRSIADFLASVS
ncbi:MAG TPA: alpha/beta fold hydrolase [Candidatus Binatus sp.]|nr:alpha/beta fold hydrolase [Candidatus Binatus sp.]